MEDARFTELCRERLPALYRVAFSIVRNRPDAEDAVQQALLNAWRARSRARPGAEQAWLMRIVINESRSLLRRRRREFAAEDLSALPAPEAGDTGLQEAVQALPESLRTPFLLKYMEGMSEKEVAAAMGLAVSSVKNRLYRARQALQKQLKEEVSE